MKWWWLVPLIYLGTGVLLVIAALLWDNPRTLPDKDFDAGFGVVVIVLAWPLYGLAWLMVSLQECLVEVIESTGRLRRRRWEKRRQKREGIRLP